MDKLDTYILHIENFLNLPASKKIDFFAYYLLIQCKKDGVTAKEIESCFEELHIQAYSNTSSYLLNKSTGKNKQYIKKNGKYYLERGFKESIDNQFGKIPIPKASSSKYLPFEIFNDTRGYVQQIAEQTINSYDLGLFDACSVLTRKLVEVLIIECFERHNVDNHIKKSDGCFFYLSDLIAELLKETKWNISRNAKQSLPKIKKIGDLSAHNRRYFARKNDADIIRDDLRIVLEELIHIIDYKTWK
ncbi:hypothetical protein EGI22_20885 [Lacihabitans sp. LS3-19]|uniref:hypothetical protein n=1 Tax=Lacihabitans sp. LS3-19 TaxID=2487335 RepID=UPI0020CCDAA3|nr:hypothetical protein [Lacihabitans sp. LS3-19]MCP9770370.1 hypothetical protein [Lacihabitans sp. LS3-19]